MKFVIVGGGTAGLATAIALRKANQEVIVLEAKPEFTEFGAGIQLPPNCTKILQQWGLLARIRELSTEPGTIELRSFKGRVLSTTKLPDMEKKWGAPHLVVHRGDFLRVLLEESTSLGTRLVVNAAVRHIDFEKPRVRTQDERVFDADAVIGADGEHSASRKALLGRDPVCVPSGKVAYRLSLPAKLLLANPALRDLIANPRVSIWMGPQSQIVGYYMASHAAYNLVVGLPDGGNNETLSTGANAQSADLLRTHLQDWDPTVTELLRHAEQCYAWKLLVYPDLVHSPWLPTSGKFTLIGDAAHAIVPHLAQGAAQSVEDAAFLGKLLTLTRGVGDIPRALSVFQFARADRIAIVGAQSMRVGRLWALGGGEDQRARDAALLEGTEVKIQGLEGFPNPFEDEGFTQWLYGTDVSEAAETAWCKEMDGVGQ